MRSKKEIKTTRSSGAIAPEERNAANRTKSEQLIKEIRRHTKRVYSAEQKIIIVMEGIRSEVSIAELCRRYGIAEATYYKWNKEFIEAGKKRLSGDEVRQATSSEVEELRRENRKLKESLADMMIRYDIQKKMREIWDHYSSEESI
jgi:transposase